MIYDSAAAYNTYFRLLLDKGLCLLLVPLNLNSHKYWVITPTWVQDFQSCLHQCWCLEAIKDWNHLV